MNVRSLKTITMLSGLFLSSLSILQTTEAIQKGVVNLVKSIQDFDAYIKSGNYVVAYFGSPTCGPCKAFHDTYYAMPKEYPDVLFLEISYGSFAQSEQLLNRYGVRSFPTFVFFNKSGTKVGTPVTGMSDSTKGKIVAGIVEMKGAGCPVGTQPQQSYPAQPSQQGAQPSRQPQQMPQQQPMRQQAQPMQRPVKQVQQPVVQQAMPQQMMQQQPRENIIYHTPQEDNDEQEAQRKPAKRTNGRFNKRSIRRPRQKQNFAQ